MSKNNKPVEASSVHSYSLKVDGPTNLKGVKATTIEESEPLFPLFVFDNTNNLLPLPFFPPGMMLSGNMPALTTANPIQRFAWNSRWTPVISDITTASNNHIRLQPFFDRGYTGFCIGFTVYGPFTSTASVVRNMSVVLRDRTTGTFFITTNFPIRVPGNATSHITQNVFTPLITEAIANQDPNKEWEICLRNTDFGVGEQISTPVCIVAIYTAFADYFN